MSDRIGTQIRKIDRIKGLGIDALHRAEVYGLDASTMHTRFIAQVDAIPNLRQWARAQALAYVRGFEDAFILRATEKVYWLDGRKVAQDDIPANESPSAWSRVKVLVVWSKSGGICYLGTDPDEHRAIAALCPEYAVQVQRWREECGPQPAESIAA